MLPTRSAKKASELGKWDSIRRIPFAPLRSRLGEYHNRRCATASRCPLALAHAIEWVIYIERIAVVADRRAIAALVGGPFGLMAMLAQALQFTEHELRVVAAMRHDMIGDRGGRYDAALETGRAQRFVAQLVGASSTPGLQPIKIAPVHRLNHGHPYWTDRTRAAPRRRAAIALPSLLDFWS